MAAEGPDRGDAPVPAVSGPWRRQRPYSPLVANAETRVSFLDFGKSGDFF